MQGAVIPQYRFTDAADAWLPIQSQLPREPPRTLSLMTFNVWFGDYFQEARARGLIRLVEMHQPDIVGLQEVTRGFLGILCAHPFIRTHYVLSDTASGSTFDSYGTIFLARTAFTEVRQISLPSLMGRHLLLGRMAEGNYLVGTVHLESTRPMIHTRIEQLQQIFPLLDESPQGVMMGDINFDPRDLEERHLDSRFTDLWPLLHGEAPGYTEDTDRNAMRLRVEQKETHVRYDRILFRDQTGRWRPEEVRLLGTEPLSDKGEPIFVSDHFGLLGSLVRD